jgi:multisubunit Na+/H+ antiporter MnhE subunit
MRYNLSKFCFTFGYIVGQLTLCLFCRFLPCGTELPKCSSVTLTTLLQLIYGLLVAYLVSKLSSHLVETIVGKIFVPNTLDLNVIRHERCHRIDAVFLKL